MSELPSILDTPNQPHSEAKLEVRYEDIAQDGRVKLEALSHALGVACWRQLLADHPVGELGRQGILPILCRVVLEGGGGPVSVGRKLIARGTYRLGHTIAPTGEVNRLVLTLEAELEGVRARTHGPPPAGAGDPVIVGRVLAEHVFTRPFGPASERKVLEIPAGHGLPAVPEERVVWRAPEAIRTPPEDAKLLDLEPVPFAEPVTFGMAHTDSNQHVNSLVYPRLFEEATLARLATRGEVVEERLARYCEVAYRKPCFAGDRMDIPLLAYRRGDALGAAGTFSKAGGSGRPHCYLRTELA